MTMNSGRTRTTPQVFLPLLLWLFIAGCSGTPSEGMGRRVIERRIESQAKGNIKLLSFRKTNGMGNESTYQIDFQGEIEFLADGAWTRGSEMVSSPLFEFSPQRVGGSSVAQFGASIFGTSNVRKGQRETIKGILRFQKTEKGWRSEDGNVY